MLTSCAFEQLRGVVKISQWNSASHLLNFCLLIKHTGVVLEEKIGILLIQRQECGIRLLRHKDWFFLLLKEYSGTTTCSLNWHEAPCSITFTYISSSAVRVHISASSFLDKPGVNQHEWNICEIEAYPCVIRVLSNFVCWGLSLYRMNLLCAYWREKGFLWAMREAP